MSSLSSQSSAAYAGLQHGFVLADKPRGLASAGLVGRLKRELSRQNFPVRGRRLRVGHTGTLDRFASGLMVLLVGKGTAVADRFLHADKGYLARLSFGRFTDTHDPEGKVQSERTPAEAREFLRRHTMGAGSFRDDAIMTALQEIASRGRQRPPVYSALKQDGRRFSDRARAGEIRLPAEREITVYELHHRGTDLEAATVDFEIHVSGGTYIRSIARDLSEALNFPLHLAELRRFRLGEQRILAEWPTAIPQEHLWAPRFFTEEQSLDEAGAGNEAVAESSARIQDLRLALADWPAVAVVPEQAVAVQRGQTPCLTAVPQESEVDFWLGLGGAGGSATLPGELAAGVEAAGGLLAWARSTGGGGYRYQRVFV